MNYYLSNLFTVAGLLQPSGKVPANYMVDWTVTVPQNNWDHLHYVKITYGVPVTLAPPVPPEIPPIN